MINQLNPCWMNAIVKHLISENKNDHKTSLQLGQVSLGSNSNPYNVLNNIPKNSYLNQKHLPNFPDPNNLRVENLPPPSPSCRKKKLIIPVALNQNFTTSGDIQKVFTHYKKYLKQKGMLLSIKLNNFIFSEPYLPSTLISFVTIYGDTLNL